MGCDWLPTTPEEKAEYQRIRGEWQKYQEERHQVVSKDVPDSINFDEVEDFDELEDEDEAELAVRAGRALLALFLLWTAFSIVGYLKEFFKG